MNAYLIHTPSGTFGQTEAGCHAFAGAAELVAQVSLDASDEEIASFMTEANLSVHLITHRPDGEEHRYKCFKRAFEVPLSKDRAGLYLAYNIQSSRNPHKDDPFVRASGLELVFSEVTPAKVGAAAATSLDSENLAYQRTLLGR